jgi:hypothetical protein
MKAELKLQKFRLRHIRLFSDMAQPTRAISVPNSGFSSLLLPTPASQNRNSKLLDA